MEATPGIFETTQDPVVISNEQLASLVRASKSSPKGRARLLLHAQRSDNLHEMIIVLPSDSCDHPHINFKSGKSFLALSGQFAVLRFSDDGNEISPIILSACDRWSGARIVRLREPAWHTIIPLAGDTAFLETIIGPFEGNRFAPWFPKDGPERANWEGRLREAARSMSQM